MAAYVEDEIATIRRGQILHPTYQIVLDALNEIHAVEKKSLTLLDVGCGVGLYCAVTKTAKFVVCYDGVDFNEYMITRALELFPQSVFMPGDATNLHVIGSGSYNVVLAGAVLEHIPEWKLALSEICRVSGRWLILHRTLLTIRNGKTRTEQQTAYDQPVWRVYINRHELEKELEKFDFRIVKEWAVCIDGGENRLGEQRTFLCQRA